MERKQLKTVIGPWHVYHWSREDYIPVFRYEMWCLSRGLFKSLKVTTSDKTRPKLLYSGSSEFISGKIILTLRSVNHREEIMHIHIKPEPISGLEKQGEMLRGLCLDDYFDRELYATIYLGFKNKKEESSVKAAIEKLANWSQKESCLRLNRVSVGKLTMRSAGCLPERSGGQHMAEHEC